MFSCYCLMALAGKCIAKGSVSKTKAPITKTPPTKAPPAKDQPTLAVLPGKDGPFSMY